MHFRVIYVVCESRCEELESSNSCTRKHSSNQHLFIRKNEVFAICVISLLSILPFLPALSENFVFDDRPAIFKNKDITNPSPFSVFHHDFWGGNITAKLSHKSYRPITSITYWLQSFIETKSSARNMKIINVLLHSVTSVLLYFMTLSLNCLDQKIQTRELRFIGFLSAALFGCHPVHVEPVATIVGRADILYSCIFIIAGILGLRWVPVDTKPLIVKSLVLSVLTGVSMFCKEQGISFFIFWVTIEISKIKFVRRKIFSVKFSLFCIYILLSGVVLANLRMSLINYETPRFQRGDNPAAFEKNWLRRTLTFNFIYAMNFYILFLPQWLSFDWAMGCIPILTETDY